MRTCRPQSGDQQGASPAKTGPGEQQTNAAARGPTATCWHPLAGLMNPARLVEQIYDLQGARWIQFVDFEQDLVLNFHFSPTSTLRKVLSICGLCDVVGATGETKQSGQEDPQRHHLLIFAPEGSTPKAVLLRAPCPSRLTLNSSPARLGEAFSPRRKFRGHPWSHRLFSRTHHLFKMQPPPPCSLCSLPR